MPDWLHRGQREDLADPCDRTLDLVGVGLQQGHSAEATVAARDKGRELARSGPHVDQMILPAEGWQREDQLAVVLGLALGAGSPGRVVKVIPVGMLPGRVHARMVAALPAGGKVD